MLLLDRFAANGDFYYKANVPARNNVNNLIILIALKETINFKLYE